MAMGGQEMPPSQQIFEMVVFQGAEIQELTVLQPPPQQQQQHYEQPQPAYAPPPPQQQSPWGQPHSDPVSSAPVQQQQQQQQQQQPSSTTGSSTFGSNPWGQTQQAPQASSSELPAPAPAPTVNVASVATEPPPKPKPLSYAHAAGGSNPTNKPAAPRGGGRGGRGGQPTRGGAQAGRGGVHPGRGGVHPGRGGRGRGGFAHTVAQPLTIPNEEFDFQQSLTKFDKDKIAAEAKKQIPSREEVYNKDDFFDSLSCEALERQNNANADRRSNGMRAKQRRTDVATFGYQPGEGRGRGRGTRGRGGRGRHNNSRDATKTGVTV
jgi:protein LSM14